MIIACGNYAGRVGEPSCDKSCVGIRGTGADEPSDDNRAGIVRTGPMSRRLTVPCGNHAGGPAICLVTSHVRESRGTELTNRPATSHMWGSCETGDGVPCPRPPVTSRTRGTMIRWRITCTETTSPHLPPTPSCRPNRLRTYPGDAGRPRRSCVGAHSLPRLRHRCHGDAASRHKSVSRCNECAPGMPHTLCHTLYDSCFMSCGSRLMPHTAYLMICDSCSIVLRVSEPCLIPHDPCLMICDSCPIVLRVSEPCLAPCS